MMSETKFTKGPWLLIDGDRFEKERVITTESRIDENSCPICELDIHYAGEYGADQEANAHLISAAPEMYEMLERAIHAQQYADNEIEHSDLLHDLYDEITNLLAKARGEK